MNYREQLKDKKRIVIKVGSSSLIHKETNKLDLRKLEVLVRELSDLHNQGKDVVLVTSGAVAVGASAFGLHEKPTELKKKQACSAVGQARLMMIYQKLFAEYNQVAAQILMTKNTMVNNLNRRHARNTFEELLEMGAIPIVNENDSISSYELEMLENEKYSVSSATISPAPVSGTGGNRYENKLVNLIVLIDDARFRRKIVERELKMIEMGFSVLDDYKRDLLEMHYVNSIPSPTVAAMEKYYKERSQIFEDKKKALEAFTRAVYGVVFM